jgi:hypothetical protein
MEQTIKNQRVLLSALLLITESIGSSRCIAIAKTATERSKMFLGLALKELGTENPYPNSQDVSNKKIDPSADMADPENDLKRALDNALELVPIGIPRLIISVKFLREKWDLMISDLRENVVEAPNMDDLQMKGETGGNKKDFFCHYLLKAHDAAVEAKLWLGMELADIAKANPGYLENGSKVIEDTPTVNGAENHSENPDDNPNTES